MSHPRRLLKREETLDVLSIPETDLDWLLDTQQLRPIFVRGRELFDSRDLYQLIDTYKRVSERRSNQ